MHRCVLPALALAAALTTLPAHAQLRSFPPQALRGELQIGQPPEAQLNGAPARLAPGVRIRGENNLLQMSAALAGQKLLVHYTIDDLGLVKDVWILSPTERAREPWPKTPKQAAEWRFDPIAQSWSRP